MRIKLYVWHNCLTDYTDGVMFALAESVEEAREKILEDCDLSSVVTDLKAEPSVYTKTIGFTVWGGG